MVKNIEVEENGKDGEEHRSRGERKIWCRTSKSWRTKTMVKNIEVVENGKDGEED